jgi:conjugative transfer signal peptidase TraF
MSPVVQRGGAETALTRSARGTQRRRPLLALTGIALAALFVPALHSPQLRLVWNASASLPLGLYRIEPGAAVRIGDLALVRPSPALERFMAERHYVERNVPLLKPVAAVAGATVCQTGPRVTIDGRAVATALPHDRFGRPLPRWSGCRRLGAHELFLIAPASAASFDSRYFGPVTQSQVIGRALPIWTWL